MGKQTLNKKEGIILRKIPILLLIFSIFFITSCSDSKTFIDENKIKYNIIPFDEPFSYKEMVIEFSDSISFTSIEGLGEHNRFYGDTIARLPFKIKNNSSVEKTLHSHYFQIYDLKKNMVEILHVYFDDGYLFTADDIPPGEEVDSAIYFVCNSDGNYTITFLGMTESYALKIPVER